MRGMGMALGISLLGACASNGGATPELYGRILREGDAAVRSEEEARERFEKLQVQESLTLSEAYRMGLFRSEALAMDGEELVRLQALFDQAVGAILPRISFKGSYTRQDDQGVSGGSLSSFTLKDRTEYKFSLKQPIFSGLREFYALRQTSALSSAQESDLRQAKLLLFSDVARAFYGVLQVERDLETTRASLKLAGERREELHQRQRAGLSRRSEVLAQEAEVASIEARVEDLKGVLAVAWETLQFLTGLSGRRTLADTLPEPGDLPPAETYLGKAVAVRADMEAFRRRIVAAQEGIALARSCWFPTLTLDANTYTHRAGISKEIDWDVILSLEAPIFDGFTTPAKMREAASLLRTARLQLSRKEREIRLEIRRAWSGVRAFQSQLASLEKAVTSAQENHDIVQAEYRQGIVTNIEVLTAFNTLQGVRLERDRARFGLKLAGIGLSVQSGSLPEGIQ